MRSFRTTMWAWLFLAVLSGSVSRAGIQYTVTDLGSLGGYWGYAYAVSNSGQIVGFSATAGPIHAFLYTNGQMQDLGTLGGAESTAFCINDSGQVGGAAQLANGSEHAFLYHNGQMQDLGTLAGTTRSWASDINDNGLVVGTSAIGSSNSHPRAFLYANGQMQPLGTLGGDGSCAESINNDGLIVGYAETANGNTHAFLYTNGQMQDLGIAASSSFAYAVNSRGDIVGRYDMPLGRAFLYTDGQVQGLGTLGGASSSAFAINDDGEIVGSSWIPSGDGHAFIYTGGTMFDLNDLIDPALGWTLQGAMGINNVGQIVGSGTHNGESRPFLLTPIPEPGVAFLIAFGGLTMTRRRATAPTMVQHVHRESQ